MKKTVHIFVSGIVQGVGYRYFAYKWAKRLGIKGYVRNLRDGRVEAIAEGEEELLKEFIQKLEEGPLGAVVEKIDINWIESNYEFSDFEIR